jgi:hypothetical protein
MFLGITKFVDSSAELEHCVIENIIIGMAGGQLIIIIIINIKNFFLFT